MFRAAKHFAVLPLVTALLVWARLSAWGQTFAARSQTIVTQNANYQLGSTQRIAPARVGAIEVHPSGRYALIVQEAAPPLPNAARTGKPIVGAIALLLYDARLNKTRPLWQRPANGGTNFVSAQWLPGSDCAVVTIDEAPARLPGSEKAIDSFGSLLFFNIAASLTPRVLATSPYGILVFVSPSKPFFIEQDLADGVPRMGSAPQGTLGPILQTPDFDAKSWSAGGTTVYGREFYLNPSQIDTPPRTEAERQMRHFAKPESALQWYEWDGKSPTATKISGPPAADRMAQTPPLPTLPFVTRTVALPAPSPSSAPGAASAPIAIQHPLFLEVARAAAFADGVNHSVLVAPDADEALVLPDVSAVLYKSGGALYAVPLTRIKADATGTKPVQAPTKP